MINFNILHKNLINEYLHHVYVIPTLCDDSEVCHASVHMKIVYLINEGRVLLKREANFYTLITGYIHDRLILDSYTIFSSLLTRFTSIFVI